jgi:hypothetical protein
MLIVMLSLSKASANLWSPAPEIERNFISDFKILNGLPLLEL